MSTHRIGKALLLFLCGVIVGSAVTAGSCGGYFYFRVKAEIAEIAELREVRDQAEKEAERSRKEAEEALKEAERFLQDRKEVEEARKEVERDRQRLEKELERLQQELRDRELVDKLEAIREKGRLEKAFER